MKIWSIWSTQQRTSQQSRLREISAGSRRKFKRGRSRGSHWKTERERENWERELANQLITLVMEVEMGRSKKRHVMKEESLIWGYGYFRAEAAVEIWLQQAENEVWGDEPQVYVKCHRTGNMYKQLSELGVSKIILLSRRLWSGYLSILWKN